MRYLKLGLLASVLLSFTFCKQDVWQGPPKEDVSTGDSLSRNFKNNYHAESYNARKLTVETVGIFTPGIADYKYNHHPSIAYFKGRYIAIFSNAPLHEDEASQRVMISTTENFSNWPAPSVLVDTDINHVLTPGGLFVANENLLVAYYTINDAGPARNNRNLFALTSTDGVNWSTPINLNAPIFPCHRPTRLSSGRLILTGNRDFYYTDDPDGISGWTLASKVGFLPGQSANLVEGAIIEHADSIYTLFRDAGKKILWQESSLDGSSWTTPRKTETFTDNDSKSHLGKLPDGRFYYIGTPDTTDFGSRTPLVLSISDDGFNFDKNYIIANDHYAIQYAGDYKTGQFGYPYSMIHDDYLYVIFSRRKEKIEVVRFPISGINDDGFILEKDIAASPQLDGTKLPFNHGWIDGASSTPAAGSLTGNGEIYINSVNNQYSFQVTPTTDTVFNPVGDYTIEFRLKVTANTNPARGIDIYVRDGLSANTLLCVSTDRIHLNGTTLKELDATEYHTYRLAVKRSEKRMYLFIDGEFTTTINRNNNENPVQLLFGKSNTASTVEAYLDYLAYDLSGAYRPASQ